MTSKRDILIGGLRLVVLLLASGASFGFIRGMIASTQTGGGIGVKPEESEVEWIESDSKQYITTGFPVRDGYTILGKIGYRPSGTTTREVQICGGYYYSKSMVKISIVAKYGTSLGIRNYIPSGTYDSPYWISNAPIGTMQMAEFEVGPAGSFCNGERFSETPFIVDNSYPFYIGFFCEGSSSPYSKRWAYQYPAAIGRIAMLDENGNTVFDMVAYRFKNENGEQEGALLDKVSGQLFRNNGTGAFAIGPDKE